MATRLISWWGRFGVLLCIGALWSCGEDFGYSQIEPFIPIGNGRLEAQVFGEINQQRLQIADSGRPIGKVVLSYGPEDGATNWQNNWDLDHPIATASYSIGDAAFKREMFASYPDQVIVLHLACDRPGRIHCQIGIDGPIRDAIMNDGGTVVQSATNVVVTNANAVTVLFAPAAQISANTSSETAWRRAQTTTYAKLLARHSADHQKLVQQIDLDLGAAKEGGEAVSTFKFERYLYINQHHQGEWPPPSPTLPGVTNGDQAWQALNNHPSFSGWDQDAAINKRSNDFASGLAQMLLQSHFGKEQTLGKSTGEMTEVPILDLLPALPSVWPRGHVTGLPAAGGFTVDLEWKTGRVVSATIHSTGGTVFEVHTGNLVKQYTLKRGRSIILDAGLEKWSE